MDNSEWYSRILKKKKKNSVKGMYHCVNIVIATEMVFSCLHANGDILQ